MVGETRVPRGNQCKHGENMLTKHRNALAQGNSANQYATMLIIIN